MALNASDVAKVDFAKGEGLVPVIIQHAGTGAVLMLGYMNRDALRETFVRKRVVFFSRSKQRLWEKGETSGHTLDLVEVRLDCDADTLLITAWPRGPVCHRGTKTCFGDESATTAAGKCDRAARRRAPRRQLHRPPLCSRTEASGAKSR
jgi:phosphoribosyl-AMP cyclohydrolase / phosphoribosyl-ATP pyrophosphohydrolase